ncbi:MAG: PKD domain-containing protein [Bacteroidia bacterium]|nr:PKD domain-containing protein [Bacteroidia bacterium]
MKIRKNPIIDPTIEAISFVYEVEIPSRMKNTGIFSILLLIVGFNSPLLAQSNLEVRGSLLDAVGSPVDNWEIYVDAFSFPIGFASDTVFTDSQGLFSMNFQLPGDSGIVYVNLRDCPGNLANIIDSLSFRAGDTLLDFSLTWCENPCRAFFVPLIRNLRVDFQEFSSSFYGIESWFWDFGDGDTSSQRQPSHIYGVPGTYYACLQITDSSGCNQTFCDSITVDNCQADFTWFNSNAFELSAFAVRGNSLSPQFEWDFGDGSQGTGQQVNHVYANAGSYLVGLIVFDTLSHCRDTLFELIDILGDQECQAAFSPVFLSNDSVSFQNNSRHSLPRGGIVNYQWTFGDGTSSIASVPVHKYQNPGDYLVCLLMEDDFGCRDSICQTISILPGPVCHPDFVFSPINNLTVAFSALFIEAGNSYSWTLQDGSSYSTPSFFHTFSRPGMYEVCLTVSDSTGSCIDSLCQDLTLLATELCVSDFTWNKLDSNRFAFFSLAAVSDPASATYSWDFGDGTGSTALNPVHTYSNQGPWEVCLQVEDRSTNCIQEECYTVVADTGASAGLEISGWVNLNGLPSFDANVSLYRDIVGQNEMEKWGEDPASFEAYRFTELGQGSYLVRAEEMEQVGFIPTYLGNVLYWQDATATVVNNRNVVNPRIELIPALAIQGSASIKGKIFDGLNQNDGPGIKDVVVLLLASDLARTPITYEKTDSNGNYTFSSLPTGAYWLQPEIPGVYVAPKKVSIFNQGQQLKEISFGIGEGFGFPVSVDPISESEVFPNPADDYVEIQVMALGELQIKAFDVMGKLVWEDYFRESSKKLIQTSEWPDGIYRLEVSNGKNTNRLSLLVRH